MLVTAPQAEEWLVLESYRNIPSMAVVDRSLWMVGPPGLVRFSPEGVRSYDSTDHASIGKHSPRLYSDGSRLYITQFFFAGTLFPTYNRQYFRFENEYFPYGNVRGQVIDARNDTLFTIEGSTLVASSQGGRRVIADSLPLRGGWGGSISIGSEWDEVPFFVWDGKGGFWFAKETYTDVSLPPRLYQWQGGGRAREMKVGGHNTKMHDGALDSQGRFWLADDSGLHVHERNGFRNVTAGHAELSGRKITQVYRDRQGLLWAAAERSPSGEPVLIFTVTGGRLTLKRSLPSLSQRVTDIVQDREGNIWFSGAGMPVQIYHEKQVTATHPRMAFPHWKKAGRGRIGSGIPLRGGLYLVNGRRSPAR